MPPSARQNGEKVPAVADEGAAAFLIADDVQNPHRLQIAETAFLPHVNFAQRKAFAPTSF
ncbi:hypothetical protein [Rhizobium sp. 007]|uniref:hypothetical protein n=1 Tax=Rhizobium sp. 007 TaxID=2785056 RepID=UPI00188FDC10|nr:hypothetical protein [Rhizobium sp. 007]QPB20505.1 hypothetical protein ISN39_03035 [Rhizobium sp. 007]